MPRISGILLVLALALTGLTVPADAASAPSSGQAVATRPAVVETKVIGHSRKGRPIVAWRLGDPTSPVKTVVIAAMHGNERGPIRILRSLRDGRKIRGGDIWVIPQLNPDGVARHSRKNARGVDLNRNFPVRWKRQYGNYNSGPRPASEPETRAAMAFLREVRPRFVISFHQPLNGVDVSYGKSRPLAHRLARNLRLPRKVFRCNSGCHGTMTQWFNRSLPGAALTVEYAGRMSWRQKNLTGPRGVLRSVGATR